MKVDIIAEIGINHDGSFDKALHMIDEVAATGVRIVKFQHYDALRLLGPDSPYLAYATKCQFTKEEHERLKEYCDMVGVEYLVSVFDVDDVAWADKLCKRHKVASRMNQNYEFLKAVLATGKEVIISINTPLAPEAPANVRYMYCITKYPTPVHELEYLPCNARLGLSSHCPSIKPALNAVAQGANLIEQHVKFADDTSGCDMSSSITFDQLASLHRFANVIEVI
jgi:sialic acid synthase SpsE